jgi:hypothetical protein
LPLNETGAPELTFGVNYGKGLTGTLSEAILEEAKSTLAKEDAKKLGMVK